MLGKDTRRLVAGLLLFCVFESANALSISLVPHGGAALATYPGGDPVILDVVIDFSEDPTLGGFFEISFDHTLMMLVGYEDVRDNPFDYIGDPDFSRPPDLSPGFLGGIAFGHFGGLTTGVVGSVTFQPLDEQGFAAIGFGPADAQFGPFVSAVTFVPQTAVEFISPAGIPIYFTPVPAAAWLMTGALGALFGFARRRTELN